MLPQRPAGAPPPRPSGKPPGSPPASPLGKPPGPPPGPPPGSPGQAAAAKPPPRGPPPASASSNAVPSKPSGTPPPRAEAKAPVPAPAAPAKKAPPPPRVGLPVSPAPPEDDTKGSRTDPSGRLSPRPPAGKPEAGPTRATPPPGSPPPSTAGAPPPRGPPPGRPPPASPPVPAGAPPPRSPPPRGPPPRGPPPRGSPPRGPPPRGPPPRGPPPGKLPITPPGKSAEVPSNAKIPSAEGQSSERQQEQQQPVTTSGPLRTLDVGRPEKADEVIEEAEHGGAARETVVRDGTGRDRTGAASPPSLKRQKTPPPSPKAPPGVPAGMVPPKAQPPGDGVRNQRQTAAMDVEAEDSTTAAKTTVEAAGEKEAEKDSTAPTPAKPPTPAAGVRASPPGDPGRRRPPPGAPPGRTPPLIGPPSARPTPPSSMVDGATALTTKQDGEEKIVIADENGQQQQQQQQDDGEDGDDIPPPPEGLPPPDGLSDDDDDNDDDDSDHKAEGRIVVGEIDGVESPRDGGVAAKELEVLRRGRFTVRCIEGGDVKKSALSARTPTVDAYLRITLGKHKRAPTKKSQVVKRSGVSPDFGSERLVFDIVEPSEFVVAGDVSLSIEIWDDSAWSDDLLASVTLSALRFMHPDAVPSPEWFPLEAPSGRIKDRMKVQVEISFEPALLGMFVLTLHEGRGLGENDPAARPNPYVVASLGEMYQKRSRAAKGGGGAPVFRQEELVLWIDKENWTNDLQLQVRSEDIGTDTELGSAKVSVLQAMGISPDQAMEKKTQLKLDGQPAGLLFAKSTFLPAGRLSFVCEAGRGLRETSAAGRMDPYVIFKADGQAVSLSRKTKIDKDGGADPRWNETIEIDIVDQYTLWVECFNHDALDGDELIGTAQCSLLPVFKRGTLEIWIQLTTSSGPGPPKAAGEIHCVFSFEGPLGVAYPQHQPGVDSFDDSLRVNLKGYLEEAEEEGRPEEEMTAIVGIEDRPAMQRSTEFSDDEISSAFKFLDLDKNLHIGAAEIRHILICMGELITDEEVDMMITMVDSDGDGQVSYEEFHRLVIDPDPSRPDLGAEPTGAKSDAKEAAQVSQDMKDRETKRWLLDEFVKENEIRAIELEMAYKRFKNLSATPSSAGGASKAEKATSSAEIDFNTWILVFNVEATGQYRKLFKLYALPGKVDDDDAEIASQKVDIREFFLGMANFVEWSLQQRTQFIFTLFDDDRSGFLSMDELVAVLKANHLATAKAVAKKAQTIMKQADGDGSGTLTLDEFLVVAQKFPNLLFPAKKKPDEAQPKIAMLGNG